MKYTSLFSAVALAAAMGTQAFGDPTLVKMDDFESYQVDSVTNATNHTLMDPNWDFLPEDESQIVAGTVTETGSNSKSLKLNTNGGLATFNAQTTKDYAATVTMKVRMVASDSPVDMSTDTTTQAALYLQSTEENGVTTYELKAFSSDSTQGAPVNVWVPLTATGFEIDHDNYDANVSIVIDYNDGTATYTVNNTTFTPVALANPNAWGTTKCLNSVAFKGTGFVDDLFVGEEKTGTFADFVYQTVLDGGTNVVSTTEQNIEGFEMKAGVPAQTGYTAAVKLYSRENGVDNYLDDIDVVGGLWTVTDQTYAFVEGATYVVSIEYTKLQLAVTVNYYAGADTTSEKLDTVNATVPYGDTYAVDVSEYDSTDEIVYGSAGTYIDGETAYNIGDTYDDTEPITAATTINVFGCTVGGEPTTWTAETTIKAGSLVFTAFNPATTPRTATFTFTAADDYAPAQGDTLATLGVIVANTLDGTRSIVGTVEFSVAEGVGSGTATLPAAANGETSLFLFGLGDAE